VDGPDPTDPAAVAYNLRIAAFEENALLVWQRGIPEGGCSVYYRWSGDGGNTWSERQRLLGGFQGCPEDINFIEPGQGYALLQQTFPYQVFFRAWDGFRWSDPQLQTQLSSFEDPETFRLIDFECLRFASSPFTRLISALGCDSIGGDVWYTERVIGDTSAWYPPPSIWGNPVEVSLAGSEFGGPILVGGQDETMHAFWSQPRGFNPTNEPVAGIFYSRWNGESWSRSAPVLNSPEGSTSQPFVILDQDNHLLAVWAGIEPNLIYFSKASSSQATRASDWTYPEPLPVPVPVAGSPHILAVAGSQLYVTYSVPLNEGRGIYLVTSGDSGNTWARPLQIFDAAGAGWDRVDNPFLTRGEDGSLHILFTRYSLPGGKGPFELYYSRSDDGGQTWSQPDALDENPVHWSRIVSGSDGVLHRLWQARTPVGTGFSFNHQYSVDLGNTWSPIESISNWGLSDPSLITSLAVTSTPVMHLLHTLQSTSGEFFIHHWVWTGAEWERREDLKLDNNRVKTLDSLSSAASSTGRVAALYSAPVVFESPSNISENVLLFNIRALDISIPPSSPPPVILTTPTPTPDPEMDEPGLLPTETPDLSAILRNAPSGPDTSNWTGLTIGLSFAVILVGIAFGFGVRSIRGKK
jgi:hypothetical protein